MLEVMYLKKNTYTWIETQKFYLKLIVISHTICINFKHQRP